MSGDEPVMNKEEVTNVSDQGRHQLPTLADALKQLRESGALPPEEVARYQANADFFATHRTELERNHPGQFVAVVDELVYVASTRRALKQLLAQLPHGNRAYLELVPYSGAAVSPDRAPAANQALGRYLCERDRRDYFKGLTVTGIEFELDLDRTKAEALVRTSTTRPPYPPPPGTQCLLTFDRPIELEAQANQAAQCTGILLI